MLHYDWQKLVEIKVHVYHILNLTGKMLIMIGQHADIRANGISGWLFQY
jgi:hypothetical protein